MSYELLIPKKDQVTKATFALLVVGRVLQTTLYYLGITIINSTLLQTNCKLESMRTPEYTPSSTNINKPLKSGQLKNH